MSESARHPNPIGPNPAGTGPAGPDAAAIHAANGRVLDLEIAWFQRVLEHRFAAHAPRDGAPPPAGGLPPPPRLPKGDAPYARLVRDLRLDAAERLVLILALIPHLAPELLDPFLIQNQAIGRRFSEFGGHIGQAHAGFLPTAETALFLLAGGDRARRLAHRPLFAAEHRLTVQGILAPDHRGGEEPPPSALLRLSPEYLERLLSGGDYQPPPGPEFPAQRITTALDWDDLVLDTPTRAQVEMIRRWIRHADTLMNGWGLAKRLKPGYRSLFYGPPGTGKTLTASLLGKAHGLAVYRVDLSRVVSKWIGETEKNLGNLFDQAQHRNWILFFDEADALFGKRTETRSANDRSANQQIAYLLQRLEDFPGVVILATNQRAHMDEAFTRRFQSSILFPMPDTDARLRLWRDNFQDQPFDLAADVDLERLATDHELAGGSILNVLRYACLLAVERKPATITANDLMQAIRQELNKEGRYLR
ncbi:MAG: ATP-binding protein [Azospirillaceae bacterium]|nr:ATP-binding protein [Azospirillaceae bacterium]